MAYEGDYRKRLKEVSEEVGKPLNLICYDMDRNHSFLSDVINGRQNMKVDDLEVFCSTVGIELSAFFGTDGNRSDIDRDYSKICAEVIYEAKKCDDVFLRYIHAILKEFNSRRKV